MPSYTLSPSGFAFLKSEEGCVLHEYHGKDDPRTSIRSTWGGIGHTWEGGITRWEPFSKGCHARTAGERSIVN
jgi:hypothetical protein